MASQGRDKRGDEEGSLLPPTVPSRMREVGLSTGKREARHRDGRRGGRRQERALLIKEEEVHAGFSSPGGGGCRSELVEEAWNQRCVIGKNWETFLKFGCPRREDNLFKGVFSWPSG